MNMGVILGLTFVAKCLDIMYCKLLTRVDDLKLNVLQRWRLLEYKVNRSIVHVVGINNSRLLI